MGGGGESPLGDTARTSVCLNMAHNELVIVVHGFGGKRLWMQPLSMRLRRHFRVLNWSYFSYGGSIEYHAKRLSEFLRHRQHDGPMSIVAHSMGSIVTRAALKLTAIGNLNRLVLLAPPNCGSPVAKSLNFVLGWACTPFRDLSSDQNSYVNKMSVDLPCPTGVIAARFDLQVPVASTYLPGLADHAVFFATHNSLLFSPTVARFVNEFLTRGRFPRNPMDVKQSQQVK